MTATDVRPRPLDAPAPRKYPIVIGAAAVLVLVVVWIVAFSPVLGVRTVTITGTHSLTVAQVRSAAAVGHGAPLIRLDTAAVRRRIEALPDVASATVSVSYPSTVSIEVTERIPVGYLTTGSASYVLVDRSGAQYRTVSAVPAGLPRFAVPLGASARAAGQAVSVVAGALSPAVLAELAEISADSPAAITLVLRDGRTVAWGTDERSQQKAALLPAVLSQPGTHFDLSDPDVVVAR